MNNRELLRSGIDSFGIDSDELMVDRLKRYHKTLVEWNEKMNLTGIVEEREVFIKHFLDSISAVKGGYIQDGMSLIDVGTGAGFPGIPLKVCLENIELTLLDSLNKRINFLKTVGEELELDKIEYIHGRAEDFAKEERYREKFDIATARAVAGLPVLLELCVPYIKVGGYFVCLKGPSADMELEESKTAMRVLGVEFTEKIDIELPELGLSHNILVFEKKSRTPGKYPRKAGKPTKNPIK
ncbi:MAG: 16S rRNA (guanine(527)-N(7))-methyltransferase RsmG [Clostridioides sp.]|jgi:16S rRNA (guanine527-N7)-methyltransferase|nr:16S rRNA (guanine(527)-N(7))-methyltransferase RsmG [Clostridioides sp.]